MQRRAIELLFFAVCLAPVLFLSAKAARADDDSKAAEGLWAGPWGHMIEPDGTVHQPVMAELAIKGNHVELASFPNIDRLKGTIRFDPHDKQISITPLADEVPSAAKPIVFGYDIKGNALTLTDASKRSIEFNRRARADVPLANTAVELVVANGFSDAGDLQVTTFNMQATFDTFFEPWDQNLKIKHSTILIAEEKNLKQISPDEARRLIRQPTPVVIAYRQDQPTASRDEPLYRLWKTKGTPDAGSEAARRIIARVVRPGTLVFVLSAQENAAAP